MKQNYLNWAIICPTLLICLVFFAGCRENTSAESKPPEPKRQVTVVPVQKGDLAETLLLTGTLNAAQEVKITSKIPGRVEKVPVEEGTLVKTGDMLIQLEQKELSLAVAQAEAAVATAQAGLTKVLAGTRKEKIEQARAALAQAKANADLSKITFERMAKLLKDKSISRTKYDEAKAHYDAAIAQYNSAQAHLEMEKTGATREDIDIARAQVGLATAALATARRQFQNATINSPIDGVVAHKNVEPGEVVSPPMIPGKALLDIVDIKSLKTMVNISENRIKDVKLGQEAIITLDGFIGETFTRKVSMISPVVDVKSRTFKAEVLISNPGNRLKPGMFARVQLILTKQTDIVRVPIKAITEGEKGKVVFLAVNGMAEVRPVKLGISDGVDVEIISGIKPGEKVIVEGNLGLDHGDKIVLKASP
ncbi:MAG: efflux RND transporter periplasmic adaptor subunit [Deltaproteobacteria bacterium]|nr:efflux RND transporter periplasmic adaptor subunit [Deltaproteobacteria bacterium]MBW2113812.1 efflux RND transporter periplasmic adaptor subunit [Deltaproteobacteria bacterium]MBW2357585.1 efflux RND transporter periplasmic adaptor subunit [Deltaproteobacteria bacterium]